MATIFNPNQIKQDFSIFREHKQDLIYLDNAATSQIPDAVLHSMNQYYQSYNSNINRGVYDLSEQATLKYKVAHEKVAQFIGSDSWEEIIFTKGATEGFNMLAFSLTDNLKEGDEIVLTQMEHHSNIVPWQVWAKRKGLVIKYISLTEEHQLDIASVCKVIGPRTKIVSLTHVSNVLGIINPIKAIANLAHTQGAVVVVDAAQSAPHLKINVKDLDCDFLVASGHKMIGPKGIGIVWGKRQYLEQLEPHTYGGGMISHVSLEGSGWTDLPWKFEAGTPNIAGGIGLGAAIDYLDNLSMESIELYEQELTWYALDMLSQVKNLQIIGPHQRFNRIGLISFNLHNIHPHDVAQTLNELGVAVRGGNHCAMPLMKALDISHGTVRVSFSFYNTKEDVDALLRGIYKTQHIFGI